MPPKFELPQKAGQIMVFAARAMWLWAVLQFVCSFDLGLAAGVLYGLFGANLFGFVTGLAAIIPALMAVLFAVSKYGKPEFTKPEKFGRTLGIGLCIGLFLSVVISLFTAFFEIGGNLELPTANFSANWFLYLTAAVIGPVLEELFFRGLLYKRLAGFNWIFAAVVSSVAFGLLHLNIPQFLSATAIGMVLAWSMRETGSVITPIIIHVIVNTLSLLIIYFPGILLVEIIAAVVGFILLIVALPRVSNELRSTEGSSVFYEQIFDSPWCWSYIVFMAIGCFAMSVIG